MLLKRFFITIWDFFISFCAFFVGMLTCAFLGAIACGFNYPNVEQIPEPWSSRIVYLSFIAGIVYAVFVWRKRRKKHAKQPATIFSGGTETSVPTQSKKKLPLNHSSNSYASSFAYSQAKGFALNKASPIEPSILVRNTKQHRIIDPVESQLYAIDCMEGHEFEYWCASTLRNLGYRYVEVTPGSGDHGVDVIAQKDGIKYAVQCKRYSSDLGNKPVQEVHAGKAIYHCHIGVVITNQHFTTGARQLADATGTLLWDREWIHSYLASQNHPVPNNSISKLFDEALADDELFPFAVDVIIETGQASVSMLQRQLKLGYARAARLMDLMEEKGIVGPFQGSTPRTILITKQQWQSIRNNYQ